MSERAEFNQYAENCDAALDRGPAASRLFEQIICLFAREF
jgi:hypothetical protein